MKLFILYKTKDFRQRNTAKHYEQQQGNCKNGNLYPATDGTEKNIIAAEAAKAITE